jgi:hypothetical protein
LARSRHTRWLSTRRLGRSKAWHKHVAGREFALRSRDGRAPLDRTDRSAPGRLAVDLERRARPRSSRRADGGCLDGSAITSGQFSIRVIRATHSPPNRYLDAIDMPRSRRRWPP